MAWRRGAAERFASFAAFLALTALALFLVASFIGLEFGGSTVLSAVRGLTSDEPVEVADRSVGGDLSRRVVTFAR